MKKTFIKWGTLGLTLALCAGLAGCSGEKTTQNAGSPSTQTQENQETASTPGESNVAGLASGFPAELPFYDGATVIESDNFNGNNYTVVYTVAASFADVLDFYLGEFSLDEYGAGDGTAYYEAFDYGDIFVKGLTIEDLGDGTTVYMTIEDTRQASGGDEDDSVSTGGAVDSNIMTYETAEEVTLDSSYPQDVVPLPEGAKIVGCSMVPDSRSGFVDLIFPADAFEEAVSFYTDSLGVTPQTSTTAVQQAVHFKGETDGIKYAIMVSRLLAEGNDTLIQITVDEQ